MLGFDCHRFWSCKNLSSIKIKHRFHCLSFVSFVITLMTLHTVYAFPSTDSLSEGLNDYVEKLSLEAISSHGKFTVAVSGGSLPKLLSKNLATNNAIDFSKWHLFFADERCVALDHSDSNYLEVKNQLLSKLSGKIPDANVHTINPTLVSDPEKSAQDYEQQLKNVFGAESTPVFDLLLLGMG
jgi:6-phosphogluconolactonase